MPLILPGNVGSATAATGYAVDNSLRFNDGSSDSLTKSLGTPTSTKIGTFSCWVKLGNVTTEQTMLGAYADSSNRHHIEFQADHNIEIFGKASNSVNMNLITNAFFRDVSAFYNIVVAYDTSQGTASNRVKLYVNGTQVTSFATETYPAQDLVLQFNTDGSTIAVGRNQGGNYADGYMCEVVFVDGQALAADSFGEFDEDSGIWKPIKVSGLTFGDNGSYLEFKGSGTSANASGMGADTSGNTNHFTVNNLTAVDQSTDTCTNNFATLNPLDNFFPNHTYSDGNLTSASGTADGSPYTYVTSSMGFNTGKWYWEFKAVAKESGIDNWVPGFTSQRTTTTTLVNANNTHGYGMYGHSGVIYNDGSSAYGSGFTTGNIVMIAVDMDNLGAYWGVNGTWLNSSDPESGSSRTGAKVITAPTGDIGVYLPSWFWYEADVNGTASFNFGSPPYAISSGNADGNGFGNFEYAVPSGYLAICTKNLAESG